MDNLGYFSYGSDNGGCNNNYLDEKGELLVPPDNTWEAQYDDPMDKPDVKVGLKEVLAL